MPEQFDRERFRELAVLYASGGLSQPERDDFERILASGDPAATLEVQQLQQIAEKLASTAPEPRPRRHVKDRLMAAVAKQKHRPPGFSEPLPGIFVQKAGEGRWLETGYEGCTYQLLHLEKQTRVATTILKLKPGARYPAHRHTVLEQCLVLSGDARLGDLQVFAGDYEKALPGTEHGVISSDTGCELLIISSLDDEIMTAE